MVVELHGLFNIIFDATMILLIVQARTGTGLIVELWFWKMMLMVWVSFRRISAVVTFRWSYEQKTVDWGVEPHHREKTPCQVYKDDDGDGVVTFHQSYGEEEKARGPLREGPPARLTHPTEIISSELQMRPE